MPVVDHAKTTRRYPFLTSSAVRNVPVMTSRTSHSDLPSEAETTSLDDLVADGLVVRQLLEASRRVSRTDPRQVITIPDSALAVVSGLDTYGD